MFYSAKRNYQTFLFREKVGLLKVYPNWCQHMILSFDVSASLYSQPSSVKCKYHFLCGVWGIWGGFHRLVKMSGVSSSLRGTIYIIKSTAYWTHTTPFLSSDILPKLLIRWALWSINRRNRKQAALCCHVSHCAYAQLFTRYQSTSVVIETNWARLYIAYVFLCVTEVAKI